MDHCFPEFYLTFEMSSFDFCSYHHHHHHTQTPEVCNANFKTMI